jgi:two-component system phosphate regulon response regulator OmpR
MSETPQQNSGKDPAAMAHVLVVDDDDRIRDLVAKYLSRHEYFVMTAENADEAKEVLALFAQDIIVLDVMMPGQTGLELTKELREQGDTPILLLTALGETDDRVDGLLAGADDYLPKPFDPRELVLRIEAILRRRPKLQQGPVRLKIGRWIFDPAFNELSDDKDGKTVRLTDGEVSLLNALGQKAGELFERDMLSDLCGMDPTKRTIDVQVTRLRRKLEENSESPRYLQTVRGKGYILRAERMA